MEIQNDSDRMEKTKRPSTSGAKPQELSSIPLTDLWERLSSSTTGLSQSEVEQRRAQYGYNELPEKRTNPILKFLSYFWGPIPWMIEIAAILSAWLRHWADLAIIGSLLIVNAIVGFWEEFQADNTIAALREKLALQARVQRDGKWSTVPARDLVPGDVVRVRIGDIIPADARILGDDSLEVDQSALTGESLPVTRSKGDVLYSGAILRRGESDALVYAIGKDTYFGKTAHMVASTHTTSHFQRALLKIGDFLIVVALALTILILSVALFRGDNMLTTLQFALVLTVAAIPVAMPTVLSVTMAVGARLLAQKQAIVSRLAAIEEIAGVDILCSDKTGTLTQNKLTIAEPFPVGGITANEVIRMAALASRAEDQDAIDLAVLAGLQNADSLDGYHVTHFAPFDPERRRTEATVDGPDGKHFRVTKGAPQTILEMAENRAVVEDSVNDAVNRFAERGFRALGVAHSNDTGPWQFLGVIPLYDPPREDSKDVIQTAREMGIVTKMITGDQVAIAREIARQLGLGSEIVDASMFGQTRHHQQGQLADAIEQAAGFAQVFPEHKYHVVEVLQQRGHIVGMTGDGVNDAPALRKADAGIAVSGATDAARSAADIVLLDPGLSTVIDAVKESRRIFKRMNGYAIYRIAETVRVLLLMTLSILVFNFYPVTAVMIVLLALLNDGAILSIAYDRAHYANVPEKWEIRRVLGIASLLGIAGVVASFGLFYMGERIFHLSRDMIQTLIYLKLSVAGHLTIFVTRTSKHFWQESPAPILVGAVLGTQLLATLISVYGLFMTPIGWKWAALVWAYAAAWFLINDQIKLLGYRILDRNRPGFLQKRS